MLSSLLFTVAVAPMAANFYDISVQNLGGGEIRVWTRFRDGSYSTFDLYKDIQARHCPICKTNASGVNLGDCGGSRMTWDSANQRLGFRIFANSGDRLRIMRRGRIIDCIFR